LAGAWGPLGLSFDNGLEGPERNAGGSPHLFSLAMGLAKGLEAKSRSRFSLAMSLGKGLEAPHTEKYVHWPMSLGKGLEAKNAEIC